MSVAGPVVPQHPPAGPWAAAGAGGSDGDDDPALPRRRQQLKSAHEEDLEPIRGPGQLTFACEPCGLAFATEESVKVHFGNRPDVFLTMHVDPRYDHILVDAFTLAQYAAIVRAARHRQGPR